MNGRLDLQTALDLLREFEWSASGGGYVMICPKCREARKGETWEQPNGIHGSMGKFTGKGHADGCPVEATIMGLQSVLGESGSGLRPSPSGGGLSRDEDPSDEFVRFAQSQKRSRVVDVGNQLMFVRNDSGVVQVVTRVGVDSAPTTADGVIERVDRKFSDGRTLEVRGPGGVEENAVGLHDYRDDGLLRGIRMHPGDSLTFEMNITWGGRVVLTVEGNPDSCP